MTDVLTDMRGEVLMSASVVELLAWSHRSGD